MPDLTRAALDSIGAHHGNITTDDLDQCGVGRRARDRLIQAQILVPVHKGVLRIASAPLSLESRCAALSMAHPSGFVTGPTGGRVVGLRRMPRLASLDLCMPHGLRLDAIAGVRIRQSRCIEPEHVERRPDGIVIATPERLAFDLAADLSALDHASVVEQLLHERRATLESIASASVVISSILAVQVRRPSC